MTAAVAIPLPATETLVLAIEHQRQFLFVDEVVARYQGKLAVSTLEKWRTAGKGPLFAYLGTVPVYPLDALVSWERQLTLHVKPGQEAGRIPL
ncbi:hypothetical protein [Pseudomonas sp. KCJK9000]|uniref:hypothetical protein n=1 Tax=Pseudomonas sp. KCJK9000 TaxID=3344566 RepID=UPI003905E0E6